MTNLQMCTVNYYTVACNELKYFINSYENTTDNYYNPVAVQAQQIVEKLLKHIVDEYCAEDNCTDVLRSNKVQLIYDTITKRSPEFKLERQELSDLSDFYLNTRYPTVDYTLVSKETADKCVEVVKDVKLKVDAFIEMQNKKGMKSFIG